MMRKYLFEIVLAVLEVAVCFLPASILSLMIILAACFLFSIALGVKSKHKIKYFNPLIYLAFIPSALLLYNESALIYVPVYIVVSVIGMTIGVLIRRIFVK